MPFNFLNVFSQQSKLAFQNAKEKKKTRGRKSQKGLGVTARALTSHLGTRTDGNNSTLKGRQKYQFGNRYHGKGIRNYLRLEL